MCWGLIRKPRGPFTEDDTNFLQSVANVLALSVDRRRGEQALRESEKKYRDLADFLPQAVFELDDKNEVTFANRLAFRMFGYSECDLQSGLDGLEMLVPEDRERAASNAERVWNGEDVGGVEYTALRKDGGSFPALIHTARILEEGKPIGFRGVVIDLTERKQMEEELLKAQKLESIGVLAGGIAHDFNNILAALMGSISLAKDGLPKEEPIYELLEEAERASAKARALTQQLLTFSRGGAPVRKIASLEEIIRESSAFALRGSSCRCDLVIEKDLWPVEIDSGQINQVIHNLVINADQAMPQGGVIDIRVENHITAKGSRGPLRPNRYVKISIRDRGVGIPPEHLDKIFDPYFTTKQKGSGLGLATAFSIARRHNGHLAVGSELGEGSTFDLYLPAAEPRELTEEKAVPDGVQKGRGKVLVMDDEQTIRNLITLMLNRLGYDVLTAAHGEEAVESYLKAEASGAPFDAVIVDLTVPGGMGGKQVMEELRRFRPDVRVVVSSGYSNDPIMSNYKEHGFCGVAAKPYNLEELSAVLKKAIDS